MGRDAYRPIRRALSGTFYIEINLIGRAESRFLLIVRVTCKLRFLWLATITRSSVTTQPNLIQSTVIQSDFHIFIEENDADLRFHQRRTSASSTFTLTSFPSVVNYNVYNTGAITINVSTKH